MKCPYCNSEHIEEGIAWGRSSESGSVGLKYNSPGFFPVTMIAQAYSDLCLDCKSIIRTYIKEETDKAWNHNSGTLSGK